MQFGYPYLIRLRFLKIHSNPDPVLKCRIRLDRDSETGSCSTLLCFWHKQLLSKAIPTLEVQTVYKELLSNQPLHCSVEQIGDFCNPNPVQNFY